MPEQPPDPRHYEMKVPPEPEQATLKKRDSENQVTDPDKNASKSREEDDVIESHDAKPKQ
jgi:hypothetical protein